MLRQQKRGQGVGKHRLSAGLALLQLPSPASCAYYCRYANSSSTVRTYRAHQLAGHLRRGGVRALYGDAANPILLEHAHLAAARVLVLAISDPPVTRHVIEHGRRLNPRVPIVARSQSEAERRYLLGQEIQEVVLGEREVAAEMARYTLHRFGVSGPELQAITQHLRQNGAIE